MPRSKATFWTLDAETDPFKSGRFPWPFIFGAYEGCTETYVEFSTPLEVAEFFRDKKTTVYAHNGGKFDFHYLRGFINSDEPVMVIAGRMAKFRIGECEFRDSLNLFPNTRLKDFGNKIEIDYALMEPDRRNDPNVMAEIKKYLRQDCVGLWDVIRRYWDDYGKSLTQAGASMKYWKKMSGIEPPRQSRAQHELYRPYYYGGRVQCFDSGSRKLDFGVADINSAYPYAMLSEHPISPIGELLDHLPGEGKLHRCMITLDCSSRGAFPWKTKTGEMYFPEDDGKIRRYHITGYEFITALELGLISNIHIKEIHYFTQVVNFREYIMYFFELREEARRKGDVAGRTFGKYFMNSLYGKFGANPEKYREYVIASADTLESWSIKGFEPYNSWGDRYLMARSPLEDELNDLTGKWRYYNVATAASITGYVRAYLLRGIVSCSGVVYCDTDSIAAKDTSRLNFGDGLGRYKNEGDFDRYHIAGKKMYAFHKKGKPLGYDPECDKESEQTWKIACKGVNFKKGVEIDGKLVDGPEVIRRIAAGGQVTFNPEVPAYSIARDIPDIHHAEYSSQVRKFFISREIRKTAKNISVAPDI